MRFVLLQEGKVLDLTADVVYLGPPENALPRRLLVTFCGSASYVGAL